MQPNQMPGNDYDFILGGGQSPGSYQNPGDKKKRLLVVLGGGAVLLMVFAIVFSLIFGGGDKNTAALVSLAQRQTELMRVADIGIEKSRGSASQNLAVTTKLSVASSQNELLPLVGRKVPPKELSLNQNSKIDEQLTAAEQNNRFDEEFTEIINSELTDYAGALQQAIDATPGKATRAALLSAYQNTQLLLGVQ
jgi:hypothetical protein